jgi:cellobiose phosphorylase
VPKAWREFKVTRVCRGVTYHITLKNPDGKSKGVRRLLVDGREASGNLIPWLAAGEHTVVAEF